LEQRGDIPQMIVSEN